MGGIITAVKGVLRRDGTSARHHYLLHCILSQLIQHMVHTLDILRFAWALRPAFYTAETLFFAGVRKRFKGDVLRDVGRGKQAEPVPAPEEYKLGQIVVNNLLGLLAEHYALNPTQKRDAVKLRINQ